MPAKPREDRERESGLVPGRAEGQAQGEPLSALLRLATLAHTGQAPRGGRNGGCLVAAQTYTDLSTRRLDISPWPFGHQPSPRSGARQASRRRPPHRLCVGDGDTPPNAPPRRVGRRHLRHSRCRKVPQEPFAPQSRAHMSCETMAPSLPPSRRGTCPCH